MEIICEGDWSCGAADSSITGAAYTHCVKQLTRSSCQKAKWGELCMFHVLNVLFRLQYWCSLHCWRTIQMFIIDRKTMMKNSGLMGCIAHPVSWKKLPKSFSAWDGKLTGCSNSENWFPSHPFSSPCWKSLGSNDSATDFVLPSLSTWSFFFLRGSKPFCNIRFIVGMLSHLNTLTNHASNCLAPSGHCG